MHRRRKEVRMSKLEKITFCPENDEPVDFYVLEQTRILIMQKVLQEFRLPGQEAIWISVQGEIRYVKCRSS